MLNLVELSAESWKTINLAHKNTKSCRNLVGELLLHLGRLYWRNICYSFFFLHRNSNMACNLLTLISPSQMKVIPDICHFCMPPHFLAQGGRYWGTEVPALHERSGSSTKRRTPNIRYFVAKLSIVTVSTCCHKLSKVATSCHTWPKVTKSGHNLPQVVNSCHKLPHVAKSYQKLPQASKICHRLPQVVKSCHKLPHVAISYKKLPQVTKSCHRLP